MADADEITTPAEAKHTLVELVQELHRVLSALRRMDAPVHDFTLDAMQETIGDRLVKDLKNFTASYNRQIAKRDELTILINALTSLQQERTDHAVTQRDLNTATDDRDAARASLGTVNQSLQDEQTQHGATRQALTDERRAHGNTTTTLTNASISGLLVTDALTRPRVSEDSVTNDQTDHANKHGVQVRMAGECQTSYARGVVVQDEHACLR